MKYLFRLTSFYFVSSNDK